MSNSNISDSPCIRQCTLDGDDVCVGCFRHLEEICAWTTLDEDGKNAILQRCEQRKSQLKPWHFSATKCSR
ncbi:DUF1289 domain-containing protein [Agarivorans sp. MS3-6]|uniref:DUF1289 domain-containing protein n=1 Tax=Agarivorans sp. TSD2052 TaxID=2937286 RepID=UPI00200CE2E6|nr:DUF1289 domain-containing protein [Agarivorans sp. TSD2052]UPW17441.1 DUF1289 domain-containing protein [Agarivorans sp. TSD2052]